MNEIDLKQHLMQSSKKSWRLPTIFELEEIYQSNAKNSLSKKKKGWYWSSSTESSYDFVVMSDTLCLNFENGERNYKNVPGGYYHLSIREAYLVLVRDVDPA